MEPSRDARVDQLFERALELEASARAAWLAVECAGDDALRREVEQLVELSEREVDDLIAPVRALAADAIEEGDGGLEPGDRIGPWTVVDRIGRGGMGVVHLAERADGSFEKRVAIKVLPNAASSREAVLRFEQERRILGRLSHPHVAQLVDGGVDARGLPYLVLEYVEGEPVDLWCDRRRSTLDERLRLVVEIATALQAAHRNLVVHRDIKPSNLLVTAEGDVKVLDFGIAKLLDPELEDAGLTRTDGRPMTPTWASPEQVAGQPITTASDVYQLGLLLYELVTGLRPQAARTSSLAELVDLVCRHEPLPPSRAALVDDSAATAAERAARRATTPSRLARRLRPDLDAIVACALAKEPDRRYASAAALADDLERFLDGRPVRARRATLGVRAGKWIRRNPALAAAGAVAALLSVGYSVAVTLQARAIERQRQRAEVEAAKASEVECFVLDLFQSSDPATTPGREVTARELLERGVARIDTELAGQPEVQARLRSALGEIHGELGLFERGRELVEQALGRQRELYGERHPEVADSLRRLGMLARRTADWDAARAALERAVELDRELRPTDSRERARGLAELGILEQEFGRLDRAEQLYTECLEIHRRLGAPGGIAVGLNNLGTLLSDRGDFRGAERHYREALDLNRRAYGPRHPRVALNLSNLGLSLRRQGRPVEAIAPLEEALAIQREAYGAGHPLLARQLMVLGFAQLDVGDLEAAEGLFQEALPILAAQMPAVGNLLASAHLGLGQIRVRQGRGADAEPLLERALATFRASYGGAHHRIGEVLLWLGRCRAALGRRDEALAAWREGLPMMRPGADAALVAEFRRELGGEAADAASR
jgi:serine/threonine-protein kinase